MKPKKSNSLKLLAFGGLSILFSMTLQHAQCAGITFDPSTTISADTDVSTDGDLVSAVNAVGGSEVTLNGVTFATGTGSFTFNFEAEYGAFGSAATPYSGLSSNYQTLLASGKFQGTGGSVTINGLTTGRQYAVQIWCNDSRAGGNYSSNVTSPGGNSVSVLYNNAGGADGGLGQFTIGRFTADAETQTFTISSSPVISVLNAIQLRDVTIVPTVTWKGNLDGTWDTSSLNWTLSGGAATTYADGDNVVFDDTATGTTAVSAAAAVSPLYLVVNNPTKDYSIGGSAITGSSGLSKSGAGNLTLTAVNTFTGGITISAGTLTIGGSGLLGGGTYAGNIAKTGSFVYDSSAKQILSGTISGGGVTTASNGTLALDLLSRSNNAWSNLGAYDVGSGGTLELNTTAVRDYYYGTVLPVSGTVFTGSGTIIKTGTGIVDLFSGASINGFSGLVDVKEGILADQSGNWTVGAMILPKLFVRVAAD